MQPVYEAVEALILELTRSKNGPFAIEVHNLKLFHRVNNCRSEGGCLPGEWGESSYKLAIRAATLVRVKLLLFMHGDNSRPKLAC